MNECIFQNNANKIESITSAIINCSLEDGSPDFKIELTCFNEDTYEDHIEWFSKLAFHLMSL